MPQLCHCDRLRPRLLNESALPDHLPNFSLLNLPIHLQKMPRTQAHPPNLHFPHLLPRSGSPKHEVRIPRLPSNGRPLFKPLQVVVLRVWIQVSTHAYSLNNAQSFVHCTMSPTLYRSRAMKMKTRPRTQLLSRSSAVCSEALFSAERGTAVYSSDHEEAARQG